MAPLTNTPVLHHHQGSCTSSATITFYSCCKLISSIFQSNPQNATHHHPSPFIIHTSPLSLTRTPRSTATTHNPQAPDYSPPKHQQTKSPSHINPASPPYIRLRTKLVGSVDTAVDYLSGRVSCAIFTVLLSQHFLLLARVRFWSCRVIFASVLFFFFFAKRLGSDSIAMHACLYSGCGFEFLGDASCGIRYFFYIDSIRHGRSGLT